MRSCWNLWADVECTAKRHFDDGLHGKIVVIKCYCLIYFSVLYSFFVLETYNMGPTKPNNKSRGSLMGLQIANICLILKTKSQCGDIAALNDCNNHHFDMFRIAFPWLQFNFMCCRTWWLCNGQSCRPPGCFIICNGQILCCDTGRFRSI